MKILVVGAGFAGAVYARTLADAGHSVTVIDKRPHLAGNAYDFVDANGVRVHLYGPHLFHTKSQRIIDWLKQFGSFVPYQHRVCVLLPNGRLAPLPINLDTVNAVFGTQFTAREEVEEHLRKISIDIEDPKNAAEYLHAKIGTELTDLFFRPYTKKMWGFDLEDMSAAVVKRIPLRFDRVDTYFADDETQMMPANGYTTLFESIFQHERIEIRLETAFSRDMLPDYGFCFNAMPIDEYFGFELGDLPYRSIRFHVRDEADGPPPNAPVTNFTDSGPFTRETTWDALPRHRVEHTGRRTITKEEPCDYKDNGMERYYPVKTADGRFQVLYEKYKKMAEAEPNMEFIGRCGTYQYLDMDQVINQSLAGVERWLSRQQS